MKKRSSRIVIKGFSVPKEIFTKKFAPCDLKACKSACCKYGCVMGEVRIGKINKLLPKLFPLMRPEAVELVKKKNFHDKCVFKRGYIDQTHRHYNVRSVNGGCVFLTVNSNGGCVLQKYGTEHKVKYSLKPEWCYHFPVDLVGKRLNILNWKGTKCLHNRKPDVTPMYISCEPELTGILGKDGYKELLKAAESM